jgi:hypothetical protein
MNNNNTFFINKNPWIKENNLPVKVPGFENLELVINNKIIILSKNKPLYLPFKLVRILNTPK